MVSLHRLSTPVFSTGQGCSDRPRTHPIYKATHLLTLCPHLDRCCPPVSSADSPLFPSHCGHRRPPHRPFLFPTEQVEKVFEVLEQHPEPPVLSSLHRSAATPALHRCQISLCGEPLHQGFALPFWCSDAFLTLPWWCRIPRRAICPSSLVAIITPPRRPSVRFASMLSPLSIQPPTKPPYPTGAPCAVETRQGDLVIVWVRESPLAMLSSPLCVRITLCTVRWPRSIFAPRGPACAYVGRRPP
jgi:hypothetical protein